MAFENKPTSTPKDFFLHLFNIVTFYIAVVNFIILFINYINVLFPDPLNSYYYGVTDAVRICMAILIISIPAYIITSWLLGKDLKATPEKRDMGLRKWLVYLTLFLAGITIIVTLIVLLNNFLGGELTVRFFLNMLLVLIVAASIFKYYLWDLKRKDKETSKAPKTIAWVVSIVVLVAIIFGFLIIGTPAAQRARELDQRIVSDLSVIQSQVEFYWRQNEKLPQSVDEIGDISNYGICQYPGACETYEYRFINDTTFELCAYFDTASDGKMGVIKVPSYGYYYGADWDHEVGRACFERKVNPAEFKTN